MSEFFDTILSFPTIVFTLTTIVFLGFWIVSTLLGAGMNALDDLDFDFDSDVDVDAEFELDTDGGLLRGALDFLGITGMPLLIGINLLSIFSWFISLVAVTLLGGADSTVTWLLGIPIMIGSFLLAGFATGRIAKKLAHVFVPTRALRRRELVGSTCLITTEKVTADFGQAEVRDDEGGSLIVQVRCRKANTLGSGDRALIFDLDAEAGIFQISPDPNLAP